MKNLARTACLLMLTLPVAGNTEIIAFDMVGSSSQNLVSYSNVWTDAFTSPGDGFQQYQRGVSASIPFAVLDDSLSVFPGDNQGIIREDNTDVFFGVADTVNNDTSGPVSATWQFDISGFTNLSLGMDMGAMGDFEPADIFSWSYSIDGGLTMDAFVNSVDDAGSHTYTMADGNTYTLNDPMLMNGTILTNIMANFMTSLVGEGDLLTLILTAETNGSGEAFAFQNLIISGDRIAAPIPATLWLIALGLSGMVYQRRKLTV